MATKAVVFFHLCARGPILQIIQHIDLLLQFRELIPTESMEGANLGCPRHKPIAQV